MAKRKFILSTEEVVQLKASYSKSKDAKFCKKALAIRLYGTGQPVPDILDLADCSRTSLMEWVRKYQRGGVASLKDQRRGGNHFKLTASDKAAIKQKLHAYRPRELLGQDCATSSGEHWTTADLKLWLHRRYAVVYKNPTSYTALLAEVGFSYQRTEKIYKSKSALKLADFEEQLEKN